MTQALQLNTYLPSFFAFLFRNLVANRPHHNAGVVTVIQNKVCHIFHGPFLKETGIAVLTLRINPHIERLGHHHHTQRVTNVHLPRGRHIVTGANGVTAHLLQHINLTNQGRLINGSAKRS